jgi:transcriptional regulator with XRE-family HTH domain
VFKKPVAPFHCDIRTSFAKAFTAWRQKHKVPLKEIAAELGISVATVNSWELGNRFPTGEHFQALVNYTGVPPCRLFCVMASECVPSECQLALLGKSPPPQQAKTTRLASKISPGVPAGTSARPPGRPC